MEQVVLRGSGGEIDDDDPGLERFTTNNLCHHVILIWNPLLAFLNSKIGFITLADIFA